MNDKVSVIISVYNEPICYIEPALRSIMDQTYGNIQIIVVIDSPNNHAAISFIERCAASDNRIQFVINKRNEGLVYSLNRALSLADGSFIARMDADDLSENVRIEKQLILLRSDNLDIVGSNITFIDENGSIIKSPTSFPTIDSKIKLYLHFRDCVPHPTWLAKREVFVNLNGYREIMACEDYDFLLRAAIKGYKIGLHPGTLLKYRLNSTSITSTKRSIQHTSHYIIRKAFRHGEEISMDSYEKFMNGRNGQRMVQSYEKCFSSIAKLKCDKKGILMRLIYGGYIFLSNSATRRFISDKIICGLIK